VSLVKTSLTKVMRGMMAEKRRDNVPLMSSDAYGTELSTLGKCVQKLWIFWPDKVKKVN